MMLCNIIMCNLCVIFFSSLQFFVSLSFFSNLSTEVNRKPIRFLGKSQSNEHLTVSHQYQTPLSNVMCWSLTVVWMASFSEVIMNKYYMLVKMSIIHYYFLIRRSYNARGKASIKNTVSY